MEELCSGYRCANGKKRKEEEEGNFPNITQSEKCLETKNKYLMEISAASDIRKKLCLLVKLPSL